MTSFESINIIKLTGDECFTFLNNQTISKIEPTEGTQCHYSAICNPKGRVLYSFFVFTDKDQIHLAITNELSQELVNFLNMRRFRMAVDVQTNDDLVLALKDGTKENNHFPLQLIAKNQVSLTTSIWPIMFEWKLPWIEKAYQEKHIPQHLSLDLTGSIDFKKGCYPGQEIIARLHYLGEVKKRLKLIQVTAEDHNQTQNKVTEKFKWCSDTVEIQNKHYRQAVVNVLSNTP